jgi:hypothetical protein
MMKTIQGFYNLYLQHITLATGRQVGLNGKNEKHKGFYQVLAEDEGQCWSQEKENRQDLGNGFR